MAIKKVRMKPPGYTDIIHPETSADVVIEDANHRFVTDLEKAKWNDSQSSITGGASTIVTSDLTASRALVSDGSGKVAVSAVTSTQLGYLSGATGNIQTQMNLKLERNNDAGSGVGVGTLTIADANLLQGFPASHFATYDEHLFAKSEAENGIADLQYELGLSNAKIGLGGVVESGHNTNGRYIKYADGTMICVMLCLSGQNVTGDGFPYPVAFYESNTFLTANANGFVSGSFDYSYGCEVATVSTTVFRLKAFVHSTNNLSSAGTGTLVSVVAIGRWKPW